MKLLYDILDELFLDSKLDIKRVAKSVKELSDCYNALKPLEKDYMKDKDSRFAYLLYFYPINVFKYLQILQWQREEFENKKIFFDFGAGPLTFYTALAVSNIIPEALFAVDVNKDIMQDGLFILKKLNPDFAKRVEFTLPTQNVDVVSFGNVFAEMSVQDRENCIKKYLPLLNNKEKTLLILEPGTHKAFYALKDIEKFLLDKSLFKINDCPVDECPMSGKDWCHENLFFMRSKLIERIENITGLNNRFVNFCYLLMSGKKRKTSYSKDTFRMISNLIEHKGYYLAHFCGVEGITQIELQKRDITDKNQKFTLLKRGTVVKILQLIESGTRKRLTKESLVEIKQQVIVNID